MQLLRSRPRREEITTVITDACGRFCVWIPRFEIAWIWRWPLERHCYPELLVQPPIRDILDYLKLRLEERVPRPPGPDPDPGPYLLEDDGLAVRRVEELVGSAAAQELMAADNATALGAEITELREILDRPAFAQPLPPPIPPKLVELREQVDREGSRAVVESVGAAVEGFDPRRYVGPFLRWRCWYESKSEIIPTLDVPDITFRVTRMWTTTVRRSLSIQRVTSACAGTWARSRTSPFTRPR